jgi:hypothetical protein
VSLVALSCHLFTAALSNTHNYLHAEFAALDMADSGEACPAGLLVRCGKKKKKKKKKKHSPVEALE